MTEKEKKAKRCCFTGHRPDKLVNKECETVSFLEAEIDKAIADGFTTFITGCAWGIDITAAQIVMMKKRLHPEIRLIAATPFPDFGNNWSGGWAQAYKEVIENSDFVVNVSDRYTGKGVFQVRNKWMVDHSARLIAFWDGTPGGTKNTVDYAKTTDIEIRYCRK